MRFGLLFEENTGCISTADAKQSRSNMKHINGKVHYVKDLQIKEHHKLKYYPAV